MKQRVSKWRRHTLVIALAATMSVVAGCDDLKAVSQLSSDLQREYGDNVQVRVTNGTALLLTFSQDAIDQMKLDSAGVEAFARRAATFAKVHYPRPDRLTYITVTSERTTRAGPVSFTRIAVPHRYAVSDLTTR